MVVKTYTQEEVAGMSNEQLEKAWLQQEQERNEEGDNYDDENDEIDLEKLAEQQKRINARLDELERIARQK